MLDLTKPVQARDGTEVRIYATDAGGEYPVHGAIRHSGNVWQQATWTLGGRFNLRSTTDGFDLVNIARKFRYEAWVNVYPEGIFLTRTVLVLHHSKEEADQAIAAKHRIACVKVIVEGVEGEGLDEQPNC